MELALPFCWKKLPKKSREIWTKFPKLSPEFALKFPVLSSQVEQSSPQISPRVSHRRFSISSWIPNHILQKQIRKTLLQVWQPYTIEAADSEKGEKADFNGCGVDFFKHPWKIPSAPSWIALDEAWIAARRRCQGATSRSCYQQKLLLQIWYNHNT